MKFSASIVAAVAFAATSVQAYPGWLFPDATTVTETVTVTDCGSQAPTTATTNISSPPTSSKPTDVPNDTGSSSDDWVTKMVCRINSIRAKRGAQPLGVSSALNELAQKHSNYQNNANTMTHFDPSGGIGERLSAIGIKWSNAAENVAAGMGTPAEAQKAWENSPGHFSNMVDPANSYIGVAKSNKYYTQEFYGRSGNKASPKDIPICN